MSRNKILVPINFNQDSTPLLEYASSIARSIHARITCVSVMENNRNFSEDISTNSQLKRRRLIELKLADIVNNTLKDHKVAYEIIVTKGVFHKRINIIAHEFNATMIIMNRNGTANFSKVAYQSKIPVIAISGNKYLTCKNILLPLNLKSPYLYQMLKAIEIASLLNANINILSFVSDRANKNEPDYNAELDDIRTLFEKKNISCVINSYESRNSINSIIENWTIEGDVDMLMLSDREQIRYFDSGNSEDEMELNNFGLPVLFQSIKENKSIAREPNTNAHYH